MTSRKKKYEKKKKQKSVIEGEIFALLQKSLKTALDCALDDLLKDFK